MGSGDAKIRASGIAVADGLQVVGGELKPVYGTAENTVCEGDDGRIGGGGGGSADPVIIGHWNGPGGQAFNLTAGSPTHTIQLGTHQGTGTWDPVNHKHVIAASGRYQHTVMMQFNQAVTGPLYVSLYELTETFDFRWLVSVNQQQVSFSFNTYWNVGHELEFRLTRIGDVSGHILDNQGYLKVNTFTITKLA